MVDGAARSSTTSCDVRGSPLMWPSIFCGSLEPTCVRCRSVSVESGCKRFCRRSHRSSLSVTGRGRELPLGLVWPNSACHPILSFTPPTQEVGFGVSGDADARKTRRRPTKTVLLARCRHAEEQNDVARRYGLNVTHLWRVAGRRHVELVTKTVRKLATGHRSIG